jgi:hypothetical protein
MFIAERNPEFVPIGRKRDGGRRRLEHGPASFRVRGQIYERHTVLR